MVWLPNEDIVTAEIKTNSTSWSINYLHVLLYCILCFFALLIKSSGCLCMQHKSRWCDRALQISSAWPYDDLLRGHTLRKSSEIRRESRGNKMVKQEGKAQIPHSSSSTSQSFWSKKIAGLNGWSSSSQAIHNVRIGILKQGKQCGKVLMLLITSAGWKTAFTNWLTAKHVTTLHTVAISQTECQQSICRSRLGNSPKEIKSPLPPREQCADHWTSFC